VDSKGLRTSTVTFAALDEPAFSVTPDPKPTGEIVINVDMGWNGADANPPNGAGTGGVGLRLGRHADTMSSENTMLFLPGYNVPPGFFRVDGPDGFPAENMGWVPAFAPVLHHVEIHSFPDGTFNIKVTDGSNPAHTFEESFTNPAAYGGDIGLLAVGWGAATYKNLSITLGPVPPVIGDYNVNGVVDAADYVVWRKNVGTTNVLPNDPIGGTIGAGQYDQWRARFGNTSGSGLGSGSAVPEPATLAMLGMAGAALVLRRRKLAR
jgi:hypothetical protein